MTAHARDDARSTKPVRIPSLRPPTAPVPVPRPQGEPEAGPQDALRRR